MADETWEGNEALRPLLVPIGDLRPHPKNPRTHNLSVIAASLDSFGQQRPILALPDGTIVAGHGTWNAARENLGWTHIAVVKSDLTGDEVERYLLADNRTGDLAGYQDELLAEILQDLQDRGRLEGTGYSPDDVDDLLASIERIQEADRQQFEGGYAETEEELAERAKLRAEGASLRETMIMLEEAKHEQLHVYLRMLRKEYGTGGVADTVFEAVERQAKSL